MLGGRKSRETKESSRGVGRRALYQPEERKVGEIQAHLYVWGRKDAIVAQDSVWLLKSKKWKRETQTT